MHALQPKHSKLKPEEVSELLKKFNVSLSQLPKIKSSEAALPEGCKTGDVVKIDRKDKTDDKEEVFTYFRVVI